MRQTAYTAFVDAYEDRHFYQVTYPEAYVFAHSRHTYLDIDELRDGDGVPEAGAPVQLLIKNIGVNSGDYAETKYTDMNGKTTFDLARFLQIFMEGSVKPDADFDYTDPSKLVAMNIVHLELNAFGTQFWEEDFEVVNGADEPTDNWWSGERRLKWWVNYPFTFDFRNLDEASLQVDGLAAVTKTLPQVTPDTSTYGRIRINMNGFVNPTAKTVKLSTNDGMGAFNGAFSGSVYNAVTLEARPQAMTGKHVYLRWLNRHGELSYWLFNRYSSQRATKAADSQRAYVKDERFDSLETIDNATIRTMTQQREIKVFTDALDGFDYEVVRQIFAAPFADMLIPELSKIDGPYWRRVHIKPETQVEPLQHSDDYTTNRQVTITITMPEEGQIFV